MHSVRRTDLQGGLSESTLYSAGVRTIILKARVLYSYGLLPVLKRLALQIAGSEIGVGLQTMHVIFTSTHVQDLPYESSYSPPRLR